jgi:hypothetical protein
VSVIVSIIDQVCSFIVRETEFVHQILLAVNLLTFHLRSLSHGLFILLLVRNEKLLDLIIDV